MNFHGFPLCTESELWTVHVRFRSCNVISCEYAFWQNATLRRRTDTLQTAAAHIWLPGSQTRAETDCWKTGRRPRRRDTQPPFTAPNISHEASHTVGRLKSLLENVLLFHPSSFCIFFLASFHIHNTQLGDAQRSDGTIGLETRLLTDCEQMFPQLKFWGFFGLPHEQLYLCEILT